MTHGSLKKNSGNQDPSTGSGYFRLFRETLKRYLQRVPAIRETGATVNRRPSVQAETVRCIAFYLPQFHRIPENDTWWGEGFTEWTHVQRANPLFKDHVQPKRPSDLGYYSLLDSKVREAQAELAGKAGLEGFCYWHYWFGNGKRLLEKPFQEVLESGNPDFPFCLAWANESWTGIWHGMEDKILVSQKYPGEEDYSAHFKELEKAFRDERYIRINGRLLFVVYKPWELPDPAEFTGCWQRLARESGIPGFYFIGISDTPLPGAFGFDGFMSGQPLVPERTVFPTFAEILVHRLFHLHIRHFLRMNPPEGPDVFPYRSFVRHSLNTPLREGEFPVVIPNWDNTPRVGKRGTVLQDSTPGLFELLLHKAVRLVRSRSADEQLVFIKSWNEWAEGNYLEPDRQFGNAYLDAISRALSPSNAGCRSEAKIPRLRGRMPEKISVITVVLNDAPGLKKTLLSIREQTYREMEVIVIDGGSNDVESPLREDMEEGSVRQKQGNEDLPSGTKRFIQAHEEEIGYWVSEPDEGIYDAMNKGLEVATGDWVLFLNAGDTFANSQVLQQVFSAETGDANVLYGDSIADYGDFMLYRKAGSPVHLWKGMICSHQAMLFRREVLRDTGYGINIVAKSDDKSYKMRFGKNNHEGEKVHHEGDEGSPLRNFVKSFGDFAVNRFIRRRRHEKRETGAKQRNSVVADHELVLRLYRAGAAFKYFPIPIAVNDTRGISNREQVRSVCERYRMVKEAGEMTGLRGFYYLGLWALAIGVECAYRLLPKNLVLRTVRMLRKGTLVKIPGKELS